MVSRLGLRLVATGGMLLSALGFLGLSMTDFQLPSSGWRGD